MQIEIESLSHDGRGLARIDGKVAFVAGALPGETVAVELRRSHRRYDEYRMIDVLDPAPARVVPPCPVIGRCGGCDLQHLAGEAQLHHKTQVLLDLLKRQAGLVPEDLAEPLRSTPFGYRRRARLAVHVPRRGGKPSVGFRQAEGKQVVALSECAVLVAGLARLPDRLHAAVRRFRRPRALGHLELLASEASDGTVDPVIHVHGVTGLDNEDQASLVDLAVREQAYLSIRVQSQPLVYLHRPREQFPGYRLPEFDLRIGFEPGDFLQGNADVNRRLVGQVVEWLDVDADSSILDAFAGLGNFTLPLARRGREVLGVEAVPEMVERGRSNAEHNGIASVRFQVCDLNDPRTVDLGGFDAAVLDPPRAGAHALVQALAAQRIGTILYVSCQPAALARDAARLAEAGYRLARLALVDMFPQTAHIEALGLFTLRRPRRARSDRAPATGT